MLPNFSRRDSTYLPALPDYTEDDRIERDNSTNTGIVQPVPFYVKSGFGAGGLVPRDSSLVSLTCVLRQFALPGR
jgi:hypothetical protein